MQDFDEAELVRTFRQLDQTTKRAVFVFLRDQAASCAKKRPQLSVVVQFEGREVTKNED